MAPRLACFSPEGGLEQSSNHLAPGTTFRNSLLPITTTAVDIITKRTGPPSTAVRGYDSLRSVMINSNATTLRLRFQLYTFEVHNKATLPLGLSSVQSQHTLSIPQALCPYPLRAYAMRVRRVPSTSSRHHLRSNNIHLLACAEHTGRYRRSLLIAFVVLWIFLKLVFPGPKCFCRHDSEPHAGAGLSDDTPLTP